MKNFLLVLILLSSMPSFATIIMKKDIHVSSKVSCKEANAELSLKIDELRKELSIATIRLGKCNELTFIGDEPTYPQSATVEYVVDQILGNF
ncbi:hypothetical protein HBN50_17395 [Halobacteriovorax sp. GB3]|uniref:hypothetical protein n=1 Tax=Halobacteriovorax sp. GB3 TaxID=2719615 RepID=UPI00235FE723|nr:hypothetical protein [Halobacteriovorax sp. GB3]MDD0854881.1 hypothetical protein [Halobacteriovorax sp. GB3]